MRLFLLTLFSICFFFPLAGCMSKKYVVPSPIGNATTETVAIIERVNMYPDEFKAFQHITLKVKGSEFNFIGYLAFKRDYGFRALSYGELGGKVFDLMEKGEVGTVIFKPENMSLKPLRDGVIGDIELIFCAVGAEESYIGERDAYALSLISTSGGAKKEFLFLTPDGLPEKSVEVYEEKLIREVTYGGYKLYPGWNRVLPSLITVRNRRWHYELRVELLKIDVGPVGENLFTVTKRTDYK